MSALLRFPDASLPAPLTGFVGRDDEMSAVHALLREARLVTLTGAGGSGKTRLALAVAERVAAEPDGPDVAWVELASLADASSLVPTLALLLGVRADADISPVRAIVAMLQEREVLLVLDNCEHLVDAVAQLVDRLLRSCPRLRVLATSREALGVTGERSWLVPTLSLPPGGDDVSVEEALRAGAVRLFVERAGDVAPGFALGDENVAAVVQVCRRLDGLPLAVELAAARVAVLTPAQLANRLDNRFALLTGGSRSAAPRQRTLRGAVDWSYDLLAADERLLLDRLSIFSGGFTLDAAEAVCGGGDVPRARVLELLAALVTKSLVAMQEDAGTARYRLLETIREYAAERLRRSGGGDTLAERHAKYFRDLAAGMRDEVILARQARLHELDSEQGNLAAALSWSASQRRGDDIGLSLCFSLMWHWFHRQAWREGFEQFQAAVASAQAPATELRAAAGHGLGIFGLYIRDPHVEANLRAARQLWREVGDERWLAFTLLVETVVASLRGDLTTARQYADEMVALASRQPDPWDLALAQAHALLPLLIWDGQWSDASRLVEGALSVFRNREYGPGVAYAIDSQAFVALQLGHAARAAHLAVTALREEPTQQNRWLAGRSLRILGAVAESGGLHRRALMLFGAADAMYEAIGATSLTAERRAVNEIPMKLQALMPDAEFTEAWEAGRRLSFREAVAFALEGAEAPSAPVPEPLDERADVLPNTHPRLTVRALGPLEVRRDGVPIADEEWPYAKPRELLLYLLAHPDGRTREQIGLDFWPDGSPAQVKNNFHVTLHHLRKALGDSAWIRFDRGRYRLAWEFGVSFDAADFERDVGEALRALRRSPENARAAERLGSVVDRYAGHFLDDVDAGDWHVAARDRLARLHAEALLALGEHLGVEGAYESAAMRLQQLLAIDPVHEECARLLMLTLARADRRSEGLRVYERLCESLRRDLDAEPSPELQRVAESLRRGERV